MNQNIHNCVDCLKVEKKIKVAGHIGSWSVINDYDGYVLLEHNTYGDETNYLVAKANKFTYEPYTNKRTGQVTYYPTFKDIDVFETYDDIVTCLEDEGII